MSDDCRPTKVAFEQRHSDDSGVQYGVSFDAGNNGNELRLECVDHIFFPVERLDWLIERLTYIRDNVATPPLMHKD